MHTGIVRSLKSEALRLKNKHLIDLFSEDNQRGEKYSIELDSLWLNYSRNNIDDSTLGLLIKLIESSELSSKIKALFSGEILNKTENRASLHTLLRSPLDSNNSNSVVIHQQIQRMRELTKKLEAQTILPTNKVTDILCVGIGGSELGTKFLYTGLRAYQRPKVKLHFIANIDGDTTQSIISKLNQENTLVMVTSKTFTSFETMKNFDLLHHWLSKAIPENDIKHHIFAITARPKVAMEHGILSDNIFEFWDWVGGRFSVWSSVGLPIVLAYGFEAFEQLLQGASKMDNHFEKTDFKNNMPIMLALVHLWNNTFLNHASRVTIPYTETLKELPLFLQQLEMESLGKSIDNDGNEINEQTCPVVWGSTGTNGQHAFFQHLHQGTQVTPVEFIAVLNSEHKLTEHHNALLANCLAQSQSLMTGGSIGKESYKQFKGNKPSNLLVIDKITPKSLGELIALYEHKVFVQSVILNVNAFDQWGVELGKQIANTILQSNENITLDTIKDSFK